MLMTTSINYDNSLIMGLVMGSICSLIHSHISFLRMIVSMLMSMPTFLNYDCLSGSGCRPACVGVVFMRMTTASSDN